MHGNRVGEIRARQGVPRPVREETAAERVARANRIDDVDGRRADAYLTPGRQEGGCGPRPVGDDDKRASLAEQGASRLGHRRARHQVSQVIGTRLDNVRPLRDPGKAAQVRGAIGYRTRTAVRVYHHERSRRQVRCDQPLGAGRDRLHDKAERPDMNGLQRVSFRLRRGRSGRQGFPQRGVVHVGGRRLVEVEVVARDSCPVHIGDRQCRRRTAGRRQPQPYAVGVEPVPQHPAEPVTGQPPGEDRGGTQPRERARRVERAASRAGGDVPVTVQDQVDQRFPDDHDHAGTLAHRRAAACLRAACWRAAYWRAASSRW